MKPPNPGCPECSGKGYIEYLYLGAPHAVSCSTCYPWRKCPECDCWYGLGRAEAAVHNHAPGCKYKTLWGHLALDRMPLDAK